MALKTRAWITAWFALCIPIMCMECTYLFLRPRTLAGGDLHWIYKPLYGPYVEIDKSYGIDAYESGNGFPNAQSLLNAVETIISIHYIYLHHFVRSPAAPIFGFTCSVMTFSKTVLFLTMEYYCNWCTTGHNDAGTTFWAWFMPAVPWLILPGLIVISLGKDMVKGLKLLSSKEEVKKKH
ncbi:hypothetical protein SCHPADRAFT_836540 [Schizopora paradoxa]|uniref:EXPERA domain-containing protein n=1 Tax=Schizopora paradoxa TaxID=27342 RepID=A0A0H2RDG1_9AGAM|nr:hypothetical protein SCHPADRAFT_836540 [Schizopora paradoxa]